MREEWEIDLNEKRRKDEREGMERGEREVKGRKGTEEEQKKEEYSIR